MECIKEHEVPLNEITVPESNDQPIDNAQTEQNKYLNATVAIISLLIVLMCIYIAGR